MIIDKKLAKDLVEKHGSPLFVYSKTKITEAAEAMLNVPAPFGLTVRYAMKANPHPGILKLLKNLGVKIDASSGYEAEKALKNGFDGGEILLTSQQLAHNLCELVEKGVHFNATSLHQLNEYDTKNPGSLVTVRVNPGIGSGHSAKTNVGGTASSFGIWHEYIADIHKICQQHNLTVERVHTHIGSGNDPDVWQEAIRISLDIVRQFESAAILNLGGGFKVARMPDEKEADMQVIGARLAEELDAFCKSTGRQLHLDLEPGTFLVANAGVLLAEIDDLVDTGPEGYKFIKINSGMNDILRPSLYAAQHPIEVLNDETDTAEYVVVGHNCESGDFLTPAAGNPELLGPRLLNKPEIGDIIAIGGSGAYCASMSAHGYNSFPDAAEVMI